MGNKNDLLLFPSFNLENNNPSMRSQLDAMKYITQKAQHLFNQSNKIGQAIGKLEETKKELQIFKEGFILLLEEIVDNKIKEIIQNANFYKKFVDEWQMKLIKDIDCISAS